MAAFSQQTLSIAVARLHHHLGKTGGDLFKLEQVFASIFAGQDAPMANPVCGQEVAWVPMAPGQEGLVALMLKNLLYSRPCDTILAHIGTSFAAQGPFS